MAGYHQHIFCFPILVKMPFQKIKAFFFQNTVYLHQIFQLFQFQNFSDFHPKNYTIKVEKTI